MVLARGIRSYHRPTRLEDAMNLAVRGGVPVAGGPGPLAAPVEVPNVLDLSALDLRGIEAEEEDLVVGSMATLQDVIDSPLTYAATAGLLPAACRAQSVSRMIRGMATLGGESVQGDRDSEMVAALLALNAVYVISRPAEVRESPALRVLKGPAEDLAGGGIRLRAFRRGVERAHQAAAPLPRLRPPLPHRAPTALPYFTSGRIEIAVNGRPLRAEVEARTSLLDYLRGEGLLGAKAGCDQGACGAWAVLLDGRPVNACLTLAVPAQGHSVQTV